MQQKQMGQSSQYNDTLFSLHQHTFLISDLYELPNKNNQMLITIILTKRNHEANSPHSSNNLKFVLNPRNS